MLTRSMALKGRARASLQQIEEQRTSDCGTYPSFDDAPKENADQVCQNLGRDNSYGKPPAPKVTLEPTGGGNGEGHSKQYEQDSSRPS
jgi:hypothetical protein